MEIDHWKIKLNEINYIEGFYGYPSSIIIDLASGLNSYGFESKVSVATDAENTKLGSFFGYFHDSWHSKVEDYPFFTLHFHELKKEMFKIELNEKEKVLGRELYFWRPEFCFGVNFICEKNSYYIGVIPLTGGLELVINYKNNIEKLHFPTFYKDYFIVEV